MAEWTTNNVGNMVITTTDGWQAKAPFEEKLNVRKFTTNNKAFAASLVGSTPVATVGYAKINYGDVTFETGDWIVKEYDFLAGEDKYRVATMDERKKYNLR